MAAPAIVSRLMRAGRIAEAEVAFRNIKTPSPAACRSLINGYVRLGAIEKASEATQRLLVPRLQGMDARSFNLMILVECKRKNFDDALKIMHLMEQEPSVALPDLVHGYSTLLRELGSDSPEKARAYYDQIKTEKNPDAIDIRMQSLTPPLHRDIINTLMRIHAAHGEWHQVVCFLHEAKSLGIEANDHTK
ncbi:MAG: hypothetical protein SGCHY_004967, partial [Lobulomycetales sp.]